jgi:hypothetical protein
MFAHMPKGILEMAQWLGGLVVVWAGGPMAQWPSGLVAQ